MLGVVYAKGEALSVQFCGAIVGRRGVSGSV